MTMSTTVSSIKKISFKNVCRICLCTAENTVKLFSDNVISKSILDKIYLCFQIILTEQNYLPNVICTACIYEVNKADNFRHKCVTFEERFTSFCKTSDNQTNVYEIKYDQFMNLSDHYDGLGIDENMKSCCSMSMPVTTTTNNSEITFKCSICNKILKTEASLTKHVISMHEKRKHAGKITGSGSNRRYNCTKCTYSTPHSQTLINHMRRHDGERPYHCECGKNFTQSSSLAAHKKIHSNYSFYTCSVCGKQFKHAFSLKTHLRVHESGIYSCDICQKSLKSPQSLQSHMHRHYNIRNYSCEDCGATFVTCSDLLNHRKKHSTEKNVECHLCGYKTKAKKNLIIHLKRHAGNKAFKCDVCPVTVYTSSDLRRHQRVHSRDKPYPCPTCVQRFAHSSTLNKHVRNVHGLKYKWSDFNSQTNKCLKQEVVVK